MNIVTTIDTCKFWLPVVVLAGTVAGFVIGYYVGFWSSHD